MGQEGLVGMMPLGDEEFRAISELVYRRFGINLSDQKRSLVQGRLSQYLRTQGFEGFADYLKHLHAAADEQMLVELVNRLSTNHTYFFREKEHFDFLVQKVLPGVVMKCKAQGKKTLRIWSAGCSSGEEPYSIVMTLMEFFGSDYANWDAGVLATDISQKVLKTARDGLYTGEGLESVPVSFRSKYFEPAGENAFRANERVRKEVTFRQFNLMNAVFPFKHGFDVIFCRNVMIYFDQPTKNALVRRYYDMTLPGGYLFVGHSESLLNQACPYQYLAPAIYQRKI